MATRPIFVPNPTLNHLIEEVYIDFTWTKGFSKSRVQERILNLHDAASRRGIGPVLEISTKSPLEIGAKLSAFNLSFSTKEGIVMTVESAYQGSKVFERGGPYQDLYDLAARRAKRDTRLRTSGRVVGFRLLDEDFPIQPETIFYDWLYCTALSQHPELEHELLKYRAFSDIAFNPKKSINCQARSAALYVALNLRGLTEQVRHEKNLLLLLQANLPG